MRRHLHIVVSGNIAGPRATDAEGNATRGDDLFRKWDQFAFRQRCGIARQPFAQAFALCDVEERKAFQKRDGAGFVAFGNGTFLLGFGRKTVGIDDRNAALALADAAARLARLPEGQPALRWIAMLDNRAPQDQNVDAAIGTMGERVTRQSGACGGVRCAPRLDPWQAARLQFGDDAGGDLIIEIDARFFRAATFAPIRFLLPRLGARGFASFP